jgi:hypothetical protein
VTVDGAVGGHAIAGLGGFGNFAGQQQRLLQGAGAEHTGDELQPMHEAERAAREIERCGALWNTESILDDDRGRRDRVIRRERGHHDEVDFLRLPVERGEQFARCFDA